MFSGYGCYYVHFGAFSRGNLKPIPDIPLSFETSPLLGQIKHYLLCITPHLGLSSEGNLITCGLFPCKHSPTGRLLSRFICTASYMNTWLLLRATWMFGFPLSLAFRSNAAFISRAVFLYGYELSWVYIWNGWVMLKSKCYYPSGCQVWHTQGWPLLSCSNRNQQPSLLVLFESSSFPTWLPTFLFQPPSRPIFWCVWRCSSKLTCSSSGDWRFNTISCAFWPLA